jgi:hypothetical protein
MKKNRRGANSPFKPDDHQLLEAAHQLVSEMRDVCDELVEGDWTELSAEDQVKLLGLADAARALDWAGVGHDWDDAMRQFFYEHGPKLRLAPITEALMSKLEAGAESDEDAVEQLQ